MTDTTDNLTDTTPAPGIVDENRDASDAADTREHDALLAQMAENDAKVAATLAAAQAQAAQEKAPGLVYTAVADLHYANAQKTVINANVTFEGLGVLPFSCTANDVEAHGQELYARALAGDFGEIAPYAAPAATDESARTWRDAEIVASQWLVERHRDQVDSGVATTLTAAQYSALLVYRQKLRDWPAASGFPADATRPVAPDWLAAAEIAETV